MLRGLTKVNIATGLRAPLLLHPHIF